MKNRHLYMIWGILYVLCTVLGFVPQPEGAAGVLFTVLSVLFFVPGWILLLRSEKQGQKKTPRTVCILCAASLVLTLVTLVANFLSVGAALAVGDVLYGLLIIVSSPMVCSGYWVLSLFLWAFMLMKSISLLRKK